MIAVPTTSIILIRNTLDFTISYEVTAWHSNMGLENYFIMAGLLLLGCADAFLLLSISIILGDNYLSSLYDNPETCVGHFCRTISSFSYITPIY